MSSNLNTLNLQTFNKLYPMIIHQYNELFDDQNASVMDRINTIVDYLNQVGKLTNDVVKDWNTVYQWVMNDGLTTDLTNAINSGAFNSILATIYNAELGDLTQLQTVDKSNLVAAINDNVQSLAQKASQSDIGNKLSSLNNYTYTDLTTWLNEHETRQWENAVSVKSRKYNAIGNGTAIDTSPLTNAMNSGNPHIFIPAGTFLIDWYIDLPAGALKVSGIPGKSIIKTTYSIYSLFRVYKASTNYQDITFEGITFDGGNVAYTSGKGFGVSFFADGGYSASRITFRNCKFINIPNSAITMNTSTRVVIDSCVFENCTSGSSGNQVIALNGITDLVISNNRVVNGQGVGIATTSCTGVRIVNNYVDNCTGNNGIQSLNDTDVKIMGNTSTNNFYNGIEVDGSKYFSVIGNYLKGNNYHGLTISADGSTQQPIDGEVVGNTSYNNKFTGMNVIGGKNITLSANRCSANNQANNASWQYGILVQKNSTRIITASDIVVTGNISHGDATQKYGFGIIDDTTNCLVTSNNFSNNGGTGNINNTATGTNTLANNL